MNQDILMENSSKGYPLKNILAERLGGEKDANNMHLFK